MYCKLTAYSASSSSFRRIAIPCRIRPRPNSPKPRFMKVCCIKATCPLISIPVTGIRAGVPTAIGEGIGVGEPVPVLVRGVAVGEAPGSGVSVGAPGVPCCVGVGGVPVG
jgi:hypothetical protein